MTDAPAPIIKKKRGRPPKIRTEAAIEREPLREPTQTKKWNMRAQPNWETVDPSAQDTPDRLHINADLVPAGMSLQWVTDSVLGQAVPQHRADFERKGWTPVHQSDFDGQFDGLFMPKGREGEINMEGLVLMARPREMTQKAELANKRAAHNQVAIKEQALRGGDIPVTLDSRHETARNFNKVNKTIERIEIPTDK